MLGLVWIKCQPKFYCPLISHRARTLSVLHSGLRCLTFTTMALGPSLGSKEKERAATILSRKRPRGGIQLPSNIDTSCWKLSWGQLSSGCWCCESYRDHPPDGPRARTWQHFLPGPRSSRSHIRSYFNPVLTFYRNSNTRLARAGWLNKLAGPGSQE